MTICDNQTFRTIGFTVGTVVYLLVGASVFDALESTDEIEKREKFLTWRNEVMHNYTLNETLTDELFEFLYDGKHYKIGAQWSFAGAFYFATTVITMIGYGHNTPHTSEGKIFCMIYALTGIPLGMVMFQSIGERMNALLTWLMVKGKHFLRLRNPDKVSQSTLIFVSLNLCGVVFVVGALVFRYYEGWPYLDCVYYCFITLTTIGFGDYVALQSDDALSSKPDYVAFTLIFILFGLTVLSSAMNLFILRFLRTPENDEPRSHEELEAALTVNSDHSPDYIFPISKKLSCCYHVSSTEGRKEMEKWNSVTVSCHPNYSPSSWFHKNSMKDENPCITENLYNPKLHSSSHVGSGCMKWKVLRRKTVPFSSRYSIVRAPTHSKAVSRLFEESPSAKLSVSFAPSTNVIPNSYSNHIHSQEHDLHETKIENSCKILTHETC